MLPFRIFLLLSVGAILSACSSTTGPISVLPHDSVSTLKREGPSIKRPYSDVRGGVQITAVYYDQRANKDSSGLEDEWIVLESDAPVNTTGWTLNAGDRNQNYALRSPLNRKLIIYTKRGPDFTSDTTQALEYGNWIWNNSDPDTAWIYDGAGNVVDSMSY